MWDKKLFFWGFFFKLKPIWMLQHPDLDKSSGDLTKLLIPHLGSSETFTFTQKQDSVLCLLEWNCFRKGLLSSHYGLKEKLQRTTLSVYKWACQYCIHPTIFRAGNKILQELCISVHRVRSRLLAWSCIVGYKTLLCCPPRNTETLKDISVRDCALGNPGQEMAKKTEQSRTILFNQSNLYCPLEKFDLQ